jgi:hypothetical protein
LLPELASAVANVHLPSDDELTASLGMVIEVGPLLEKLFEVQSQLYFLRSCYPSLCQGFPFGKRARIAVTGTPGIAKSTFLLYILIRRVKEGHPTCFHNLTTHQSWLFENGSCTFYASANQIPMAIQDNPEFITLLDRAKGNPMEYPTTSGLSVLASSPKHDNYYEWEKTNGAGRRYMPLWKLAELQHYRKLVVPLMEESRVVERFNLVGGVLRAVVPAYDQFYDDYVQQSKDELKWDDLIREVCRFNAGEAILQDKGDNVCHKVIHYVVDGKFRLADLAFCSPLMYEKYLERLEVRTPADLFFGKWQDGSGYEAAVLGALVYCSSILVGAIGKSAFKSVQLKWSDPPAVKLNLSVAEIESALDAKHGTECLLLVPKSRSYPAFDGLLWDGKQWFPLQVTINAAKELKPALLKSFWNKHGKVLGGPKLRWYGVVPPSKATRANKFSYEKCDEREWAKSNIDQFVIPFPRPDDPPQGFNDDEVKVLAQMKHEMFSRCSKKSSL